MKITKRQLRNMIKEEKQKLNEMTQLEYIKGSLVSASEERSAKKSLMSIWQEVADYAVGEFDLDPEESATTATQVLIDILADVLDGVGDTQISHELRRFTQ